MAIIAPVLSALLMVLPGAEREAPAAFSHRKHVAQKIVCTECHAAALESAASADNLLPRQETCFRCHRGMSGVKELLEGAQAGAGAYRFSHKLHLGLGNVAPALAAAIDAGRYLGPAANLRNELNTENACTACHRGVAAVDRAGPANLPHMADCLVCHTKIDPPFS